MPMEIGVNSKGQPTPATERVRVAAKSNTFTVNAPTAPDSLRLDPNLWVLIYATFEKTP